MHQRVGGREPELAVVTTEKPQSAVTNATGLVGLAGLIVGLLVLSRFEMVLAVRALCCLAACAVPMVVWAVFVEKTYLNPSTELDLSYRRSKDEALKNTTTKLIGLWSTWAIIAVFYWIIRFYEGFGYTFYFLALLMCLPALVLLSPIYVYFVDRHSRDPYDGSWHMGKWIVGERELVDVEKLKDYGRVWFIKAFFLAFMVSIFPGLVGAVTSPSVEEILADPASFATWGIKALFLADVCFGAIGYIFTFRVLDAHIRSANPHLSAWVAALICYPPFIMMAGDGPLNYHEYTQDWTIWFSGQGLVLWLWGAALIALTGIYAWATVIFGIRFSNLTHRGIITNGPYRYSKHPAYLAKNLFWWLLVMPFLSTGGAEEAIRNSVLLLLVNVVYFIRAKTEEKHLMEDPTYRAYAEWIAEHGLIARVLKPFREFRESAKYADYLENTRR